MKPGGVAKDAAKGSIWSRIGKRAGAFGGALAAVPFTPLALAGVGAGAYYLAEGANESEGITRESTRERRRRQAAKYNWWGKYDPPASGTMPEVTPTMTYGTGAGGPLTAQLTGSAEVRGETTVKVEVSVSPTDTMLSAIATAKSTAAHMSGVLNANGPGSAGRSSPDAAAPAVPSFGGRIPSPTGSSGSW
jgi:hypothetical protein